MSAKIIPGDIMKKTFIIGSLLLVITGIYIGWGSITEVSAQIVDYMYDDPDRPPGIEGEFDEADYKARRDEFIALIRGVDPTRPADPQSRNRAVDLMDDQASKLGKSAFTDNALLAAWTELGPN